MIYTVDNEHSGERIDSYLSRVSGLSRSRVQNLLDEGAITVEGVPSLTKKYALRAGDTVSLSIPAPVACEVAAEDIPLDVVYEDADLLVIHKPKASVW